MQYIEGTSRDQLILFSERLDGIINEDNPVRFIEEYVEHLDLAKLKFKMPEMKTGRPPYAPTLLLKIYIYGYLNKLRTTRVLEKECQKNIELIWLTRQLAPDFKTIADFRRDNKQGLRNIFREFLKFCKKLNLLEYKLVAVDGTKMRAQNSLGNVFKREKIKEIEKSIDKKIQVYMDDLNRNDAGERNEDELLTKKIWKRLKSLKKYKEKIDFVKGIFEENPKLEKYFSTDPDCRLQKDNGRTNPGYNSQIVVDEKHKLIIGNDVTNEHNDQRQLHHMVENIKEGKEDHKIEGATQVVADAGYYNEGDIIKSSKEEGIETFVSHPRDVKTSERVGKFKKEKMPSKGYEKEDFEYVAERDEFICPAGEVLKRGPRAKGTTGATGLKLHRYHCKACVLCESKKLCTLSKKGRTIKACEFTKELRTYREKTKTEEGKSILKKRKELAEHPFGTIKRSLGYRYFIQRGIEKVKSEFSFITFIYNFKRVMNIMTMKDLLVAIS